MRKQGWMQKEFQIYLNIVSYQNIAWLNFFVQNFWKWFNIRSRKITYAATYHSACQVDLVAKDDKWKVLRVPWSRLNEELVSPALERIERLEDGNVVDENAAIRAAVERHSEAFKPLMTSGVPNLSPDSPFKVSLPAWLVNCDQYVYIWMCIVTLFNSLKYISHYLITYLILSLFWRKLSNVKYAEYKYFQHISDHKK